MANRLPIPGADDGQWGSILNSYLSVSLAGDGTIQSGIALSSPVMSGSPTAPTASPGTDNTQLATTAFVTTAVAAIMPVTPVIPSSNGWIDVKSFGARGDGATDDTSAINTAVAALAAGGVLVFPPGIYKINDYLNIENKGNTQLLGYGATISSSNQNNPVVVINACTNIVFEGFSITHTSTSGGRSGGGFGIKGTNNTNETVRSCYVYATTSAGILHAGCTQLHIIGNTIENTLADGIHTTGACSDVVITNNIIRNSGDDAIPCVSYRTDGDTVKRVSITNNVISNSQARGIDVVGGEEITISGNTVAGTRAAGIMIAQESSYATYGCNAITVTGNTVVDVATLANPVGHGAIMVDCADPTYPIQGVNITGNTVRKPRYEGYLNRSASGCSDIVWNSNLFFGPSITASEPGFLMATSGNYVKSNLVSTTSGDGYDCATTGVVVVDNDARNIPFGYSAYVTTGATVANNRSS